MLKLTKQVEIDINQEGEKAFPNECCGILMGRDDEISAILPIINAWEHEEQYHRFSIEPQYMLKAEREAHVRGLDVLGFYHSHPNTEAVPSEYDREHALPFYVYLIVSVKGNKAEKLTAWNLSLDRTVFLQTEYETI